MPHRNQSALKPVTADRQAPGAAHPGPARHLGFKEPLTATKHAKDGSASSIRTSAGSKRPPSSSGQSRVRSASPVGLATASGSTTMLAAPSGPTLGMRTALLPSNLALNFGSFGSKLDLASLLHGDGGASSLKLAGRKVQGPDMAALREVHRRTLDAVDTLDSDSSDRLRQVLYSWRRDARDADQRCADAVAAALHEAQFHDKCQAVEARLRADLAALVQEMNQLVATNAKLTTQIETLKREKEIEASLKATAVEAMARQNLKRASAASSDRPSSPSAERQGSLKPDALHDIVHAYACDHGWTDAQLAAALDGIASKLRASSRFSTAPTSRHPAPARIRSAPPRRAVAIAADATPPSPVDAPGQHPLRSGFAARAKADPHYALCS
ncbi:hypothetical protein AMAG_02689 [Allomyces macrogynus ATCC 38327]|uniref:Uncharacterized protein n=1 Tax=Allomyces macrogynus (strain ATCC 38327) TaxID=578462 RepID=A0A0L0S311_ALLM3|nr:hypothetical protein AMAG_02689 [Allomyces macrogynus ATCC 38327]|eukprot:KNE56918.1 hypothetical protein AMAG_02689 [Allomyces macrogynus ATCC 38327]